MISLISESYCFLVYAFNFRTDVAVFHYELVTLTDSLLLLFSLQSRKSPFLMDGCVAVQPLNR